MASLIYGVSRNDKKSLGYSEPYGKYKTLNTKPKTLREHFVPSGTHVRSSEPVHFEGGRRQPQKKNKSSRTKPHAQITLDYFEARPPRVFKTSGKTNKKGPRKWVPKDIIIYLADILNNSIETPVMVSGQWMLATHDGRKAYVPRTGT